MRVHVALWWGFGGSSESKEFLSAAIPSRSPYEDTESSSPVKETPNKRRKVAEEWCPLLSPDAQLQQGATELCPFVYGKSFKN